MDNSTLSRTELLKQRKKHCVCKYCGNELNIERLTFSNDNDARVELVCSNCQRIDYGVEKEIYLCAKYYFDEIGFNYFQSSQDSKNIAEMNIAKIAEVITWGLTHLGYLENAGFVYSPQINPLTLSEALNISASNLQQLLEVQQND